MKVDINFRAQEIEPLSGHGIFKEGFDCYWSIGLLVGSEPDLKNIFLTKEMDFGNKKHENYRTISKINRICKKKMFFQKIYFLDRAAPSCAEDFSLVHVIVVIYIAYMNARLPWILFRRLVNDRILPLFFRAKTPHVISPFALSTQKISFCTKN